MNLPTTIDNITLLSIPTAYLLKLYLKIIIPIRIKI